MTLLLIVCGAGLVTALWLGIERSRFGAMIRAAVDNLRMAQSIGIDTSRLFSLTFVLGSGLAAFGGGLGASLITICPRLRARQPRLFPDRRRDRRARQYPRPVFGGVTGGRCRQCVQIPDAAIRRFFYLRDDDGDIAVAAARFVRPRVSAAAPSEPRAAVIEAFARRHRFRPYEALPWLAAFAAYFAFPGYLPLIAQILATILFALSTDLVLGYAGIVTLGQAAFFGAGAYTAGILAAHGWGEPITGLIAAAAVAALIGFVSGLVVLRSSGLTLLMQTLVVAALLREAANKASAVTGGDDGLQGCRCGRSSAISNSASTAAPHFSTASPSCSYAGWRYAAWSTRHLAAH